MNSRSDSGASSASRANMAVAAALIFVVLALMWGGLAFYARNSRAKDLGLYRERQHAVVFVLYDMFETIQHRYGEQGLEFIEAQIMSQASMLTPQSWSRDNMPRDRAALVGYGNAIIMHNGRVVYVNGEFRSHFKASNGVLQATEPNLRIFLDRMRRDLNSATMEQSFKTTGFEIAGDDHLFTCARFKLPQSDVVFFMHAAEQDILRSHGYYDRVRQYFFMCLAVSATLLALGAFLIRGMKREARSARQLWAAADRLEREAAERNALTEELRQFKTMADTANAGMVITDLQGRIQYVNGAFASMVGYEPDEMNGVPVADLFPDRAADSLVHLSRRFAFRSGMEPVELWPRRKDGSQFPAMVAGAAVPGEDGGPAWFAAVVMDDTEGREARQALRAGEEKYKALFDESVAAVFVLDRDKNFTDANRAALELLGYSREELLSLNFRDALPEPGGMNIAFQQLLSGGRILNYEHAMRRKDGRTAFVLNNSRPLTDEFGSVRGMLCTVVDITGPKTMRERLQRNQERYQRLVENLKDEYFFYSHDTDGMFTYISPSITSILGYTPQEFMTHYTEYLADDPGRDDVIRATQLSIQGMEQPSYEVKLRHKNGAVFTFEVKEYPIFNDYGEPVGVEGLARDITARKRADAERDALQEQLLQSQKMEAVGQLAGGIAHDFNNILAVMLGSAELVLRRIPTDDPNRERVQKILDSGRRAKDLTLQMLTFSRKDKLHVQSVPINELTEELTDMLQRGISKKIVIKKDFSPEPPIVTVDVNQVIQALLNICINASDAMGKAGTLTIATSEETVSESVARGVSGAKPGAYGVVTVRDTGPGIPQDVKARIFEPFFTTREQGKGTGLGLSVALGIIHNHEGFITVDSEPDKGACFKVFLPIGTEESRIAKRAASPVQEHKQGATVLLIDDNAEFLQMGEDILTVLGYKAIKARSGREALSLYSDHRGRVDLVILDMMMPEMDGSDVFDALTSLDPQVKIVLCSGYSLEGVAGRLLKDGAAAFLQKPFDIKEFSEILSHVVSSPQ